ncbi:MAG: hypothetical protein CL513_03935 [Actinobacteria bacterium]|nr:hypothetical protein [Actinomycetota bacterium]
MVYNEVIFIFWHGVCMRSVDEIPVAHTPDGGWTEFPPLVLADCSDELSDDAVDMQVEVRRYLDGSKLVWEYGPFFTAHLEKNSAL